MKIQEVNTLTGRAAGLLVKLLQIAPFLQAAEFRLDPSYFANVPDKSAFTGTAARAENAVAQKDAQAPNPSPVSLALYSRETVIDRLRVNDAKLAGSPAGLKNFADRQLNSLISKLGLELQDDMIAGTATSYHMLGLANFIKDAAAGGQTAALGFTTAEQAAMNQNVSLKLDNIDSQDAFIELLMKALATIPGANAMVMNVNAYARMTTIAKRLGAASVTTNEFGVPVTNFNQVPMIPVPVTTITQTESDGANADCTSIYIARFAEEQGVCYATNSGFDFQDFPDYETYPQGMARVNMNLNLVVESTAALKRLSRIRF